VRLLRSEGPRPPAPPPGPPPPGAVPGRHQAHQGNRTYRPPRDPGARRTTAAPQWGIAVALGTAMWHCGASGRRPGAPRAPPAPHPRCSLRKNHTQDTTWTATGGENRADSDVDLLADLPAGMGLLGLGRVRAELETILGARVDLIPANDLKPAVRARVEPELVAL
jgi:hypothetical protein